MGAVSRSYGEVFIANRWREPSSSEVIEVIAAHTEELIGTAPIAGPAEVDAAVGAARSCFDDGGWPRLPVGERSEAVRRIADGLAARADEMAELITGENGSPLAFSRQAQVGAPLDIYASMLDLAAGFDWEEHRPGRYLPHLVRHEPVGVVAAVVAWNVPQVLIATKLAPALLAGCPVIVKAAPEAALDALLLAEIIAEADLPAGTVSILTGGVPTGEALVAHPGIDKVAFTGSSGAGRRVAAACGQQLTRVSLELGGKSATVWLDDVDLPAAVKGLRWTSFVNNGQACAAQTRVLAPRSRYGEVVAAVAAYADGLVVGDPFAPGTHIGPMVSARQRDRVRSYIELGQVEGARLVAGGAGPPDGLDTGWYVRPTVFADVDNAMRIAKEEIFGPVLCVIAHDGDDDAVRLANDSAYGLAGSVWSAEEGRALGVARRLRAGSVGINGYAPDTLAPFGGYGASGMGREWGPEGFAEYLETTAIGGITG